MATYIILCNFTEQGIRGVKDTIKRAETLNALGKENGVTVKDMYWTLGSYDIVATLEAPDDETITALGLSLGQMGNVRTQTMRAFAADEMAKILARTK